MSASYTPILMQFEFLGNLKGKAYKNNLCITEALHSRITSVFGSAPVSQILFMHCKACLKAVQGHFLAQLIKYRKFVKFYVNKH
jgi:hypothetical protein